MRNTKKLSATALMAAVSAVGSFLRIPTPAGPLTFQFLFALTAGLALGAEWGAISQAVYLCIGLLGFPVFAMGGGLSYALQPTFGFLLGLIPAAAVAGLLHRRPLLACLAAWVSLYAVGLPYLHMMLQHVPSAGMTTVGFLSLIPGDIPKILIALFLAPQIKRAIT